MDNGQENVRTTLREIEMYISNEGGGVSKHTLLEMHPRVGDSALDLGVSEGRLFCYYSRGRPKQKVDPKSTYFGILRKNL